jgi:hypothetical protein
MNNVERTDRQVSEEETLMVNSAELSTAVRRAPVRNRRPATVVLDANDGFGGLISGSLLMIPFGCLLAAILVAATLSHVVPSQITSRTEASVQQETELPLPTIDEAETGSLLRPFAEAYAR